MAAGSDFLLSAYSTQLFDSMRELSDAYDAVMEGISEKLKDCVKGR